MKCTPKYFMLFCVAIALAISLFGQRWEWKRQPLDKKADSVFAIYSWEMHDNNHSAAGEIVLMKTGRFKYTSHRPMGYQEYSDGKYTIKKDRLTLISDLQSTNIKIAVTYIDTSIADTLYTRLYAPTNNKGDYISNAYYFLNHDTTNIGWFDPAYPLNRHYLNSITSLKVVFDGTDFGSDWIPITRSDKFIRVTVLTDKNYSKYRPRVFASWKFNMTKSKIIELSKSIR